MQARTVLLHGGPYHGKLIAVPVGQDHAHIMGYEIAEFTEDAHVHTTPREGTYSQVTGPNNQNDFEWDGWTPA